MVHLAGCVFDFDGDAGRAQRLVVRRRVACAQCVPQPADGDAPVLGVDQRVAQRIFGEEEDGEVDARLGRLDCAHHPRQDAILRREVHLDGQSLIEDGGGGRRRLLPAEAAGDHLVEVVLEERSHLGAGEDDTVVVVEGEVVVGEVSTSCPDRLAVEDQVFVVHDAASGLVVDDWDTGRLERGKVRRVGGVAARLVVGHDTHRYAATLGGEQGVAHAHPFEVVEGGVDGDAGCVDTVEQRLLHRADRR